MPVSVLVLGRREASSAGVWGYLDDIHKSIGIRLVIASGNLLSSGGKARCWATAAGIPHRRGEGAGNAADVVLSVNSWRKHAPDDRPFIFFGEWEPMHRAPATAEESLYVAEAARRKSIADEIAAESAK